MTDSHGRVSEIELKDPSSGTLMGLCAKMAVSAVVAATGCVATYVTNKVLYRSENKKKPKKK